MPKTINISLFFTLLLMLTIGFTACSPEPKKIKIGQVAPSFQSKGINNKLYNFPNDISKNQILVLRFWADWCPYCIPEMKMMEPKYQKYKSQGLKIWAINVGQDSSTISNFLEKIKVRYPLLLDEEAIIAKSYGVVGVPTTYFIDDKGKIRAKLLGEMSERIFTNEIKKLLKTNK